MVRGSESLTRGANVHGDRGLTCALAEAGVLGSSAALDHPRKSSVPRPPLVKKSEKPARTPPSYRLYGCPNLTFLYSGATTPANRSKSVILNVPAVALG